MLYIQHLRSDEAALKQPYHYSGTVSTNLVADEMGAPSCLQVLCHVRQPPVPTGRAVTVRRLKGKYN